jgi:hypothetical protein
MFTAALMADSKRRLMTTTAIASLLIISWLLFSADELILLRHTIYHPDSAIASGATLLFEYFGIQWHMFFLFFLALIALTIAIRLAMKFDVKATVVHAHRPLVSHYYFGFSVTSFTFLTTPLFDYHWIFNIFSLPWLFSLKRDTGSNHGLRRMVVVCVALMIIWMWSGALILDVLHVLFKLRAAPGTREMVMRWLVIVKQLSAWSFLTVLAAIGIKTFMIEGTYVSAMFDRFVRRGFGRVATEECLRSNQRI